TTSIKLISRGGSPGSSCLITSRRVAACEACCCAATVPSGIAAAASKETKELQLKCRLLRMASVIESSLFFGRPLHTSNSPMDVKFVLWDLRADKPLIHDVCSVPRNSSLAVRL